MAGPRSAGWVLGILLASSAASAGPVAVLENGPSANRVNIVFLGDGYTAGELESVYPLHVQSMLDHLFGSGQDPYPRYQRFFNAYRVNVVSAESGADVPPVFYRDTALDASYYADGMTERLLYVSSSKANAALAAGLEGTEIRADVKFVTVNDSRYGGGGGAYATYAGGNYAATEIALHELGHSWNRLGDEYGGRGPIGEPVEPLAVNVTKSATGEKWAHWIGYEQPGIGVIGVYEGAGGYDRGMYRPSLNSKMRSLGRPFDAVAREKIILDIYRIVDPLDGWRDNAGVLVNPDVLWVEVIDPQVIFVEWSIDGMLLGGMTGGELDVMGLGLAPGEYEVSARAYDPTEWVRIDRYLLEQTVSWSVRWTVPEPHGMMGLAVAVWFLARRRSGI